MSSESRTAAHESPAEGGSERLPIWVRLAGTIGVLGVDVLFAWLLHIGGAALSQLGEVLSGEVEHTRFATALHEHGIAGLRPDYLGGPLPLDVTTAVYMALSAVVAIVFAAVTDRVERIPEAWNFAGLSVLLAPAVLYPLAGIVWMGVSVAAGIVNFIGGPFTGGADLWVVPGPPPVLDWSFFLIFAGYGYGFAVLLGVSAQYGLGELWKRRPIAGRTSGA
ncbi:hypothetical protein LZG04_21080 [Saccharothrix sp. S26]|uniref:hypothetical protein n=1 Tax=Saccharothrix sp. S26 TaxID=2907215 RepID=UPI001F231807|nr:hypothetical protein [Saccharothrix sp. S26]MCE6997277.1 hypothetical protein [Saccharothrix sp. S26]